MPVDLSASIYAQYMKTRKRAEEALQRGSTKEAALEYRRTAELMLQYASYSSEASIRKQRKEKAAAYKKMALQLDGMPIQVSPHRDAHQTIKPLTNTDYESEVMALIEKSTSRWKDIGGLENTKRDIKAAFGLAVAKKPNGVRIDSWRNILLFGPPGTGKTLLAAATAGSLDARFFNIKVSNVLSKYFGESTKIISSLYAIARRLSPSVIFLDEIESLTPPRGNGESGAERRIVSTLLAELDGLSSKDDNSYVLTIGATNLPWLLDGAILNRFQKDIFVPLPDPEARKAILEIHLTKRGHKTDLPISQLIVQTEGYSGREIAQICQTAITSMTQRANPDLMATVDKGQDALREYEIRIEPLNETDYQIAFNQLHPSTNPKLIQRYLEWQKKVG